MLLNINQENPQARLISQVVETLKQGGVIAYPTDTTYGIGCNIFNRRGIKSIYQIKQRDARKPFSFICADLSDVANYAQVYSPSGKAVRALRIPCAAVRKAQGFPLPACPCAWPDCVPYSGARLAPGLHSGSQPRPPEVPGY